MKLKIDNKALSDFERELWKDTRKLEIETVNGDRRIRKYSDKQTSLEDEYRFITYIRKHVSFNIPLIYEHSNTFIAFDYIAGTRAFNLLMDLRRLFRVDHNTRYLEIGRKLIHILSDNLREFQGVCQRLPTRLELNHYYPAQSKLHSLFDLLTSILEFKIDLTELSAITNVYQSNSTLPFRDASPKNVLLRLPELSQNRFTAYRNRLSLIREWVLSGELEHRLVPANIYHIDFSGCSYLCPEKDDWVALHEHESSIWLKPEEANKTNEPSREDLCAKFVRYSRFGGRKLAYRLLNSRGYQIRFGLDNEEFYFAELQNLVDQMQTRGLLHSNMLHRLFSSLRKASRFVPTEDYFLSWKDNMNDFSYYRDVYPD